MHQAEQRLQQRGLAGTVRADNADDLALVEREGRAVENIHARNIASHQIHRVKQRLTLRLPHMNLRAGQRPRLLRTSLHVTLRARFWRIGHGKRPNRHLDDRFSRIGHLEPTLRRLVVRFSRIGHTGSRNTRRISCVRDVAHLRPPSNLPARNRHPNQCWRGHPNTRQSQPDRSSRSSAGLPPRSCLPPSQSPNRQYDAPC